jgi:hypothetical protein
MIGGIAGGRICPACIRVCSNLLRDSADAEAWMWR